MDKSIFSEKSRVPTDDEVNQALNSCSCLWYEIHDYVHSQYEKSIDEWSYPGEKYGWSFRIKDKKRAILYLLPRDQYFKVAFVFGQKAFDHIMQSEIAENIKAELRAAKPYAEGRGIRIDVREKEDLDDIFRLIGIKLKY